MVTDKRRDVMKDNSDNGNEFKYLMGSASFPFISLHKSMKHRC